MTSLHDKLLAGNEKLDETRKKVNEFEEQKQPAKKTRKPAAKKTSQNSLLNSSEPKFIISGLLKDLEQPLGKAEYKALAENLDFINQVHAHDNVAHTVLEKIGIEAIKLYLKKTKRDFSQPISVFFDPDLDWKEFFQEISK